MRAMDLVQWQSTFPTHERPGVRYPIPQKKREGEKRCKREAGDEPRTQKSKCAASKQNKFGETDWEVHAP